MAKPIKECEWTRRICQEMVSCGAVVFSNRVLVGGQGAASLRGGVVAGASGWPDRWIGHCLWSGWLEFKGLKTVIEPLQTKRIQEVNERQPGGAYVVRLVDRGAVYGLAVCDAVGERLLTADDSGADLLLALDKLRQRVAARSNEAEFEGLRNRLVMRSISGAEYV